MSDAFLEARALTKRFGSLMAVDNVSFEVEEGSITAIIGPNGAGKTTLFNLFTCNHGPTSGEIYFKGDRIDGKTPHEVFRDGVARSFQITNFFPELSTLENVRLATQSKYTGRGLRDFLSHYTRLEEAREEAYGVLERLGLGDIADEQASTLSHGQQRHLEIAIGLGSDPDLLLMDEPTSGMSPEETRHTIDLIEDISSDTTLLVIEHDMDVVMQIADEIAVMNRGELLVKDRPEAVRQDQRVQEAYLEGGIE